MSDISDLIDKDLLNPKKLLKFWNELREEQKFWNLFDAFKDGKIDLTEEEALWEDLHTGMSGEPLSPRPGRPEPGQKRKFRMDTRGQYF